MIENLSRFFDPTRSEPPGLSYRSYRSPTLLLRRSPWRAACITRGSTASRLGLLVLLVSGLGIEWRPEWPSGVPAVSAAEKANDAANDAADATDAEVVELTPHWIWGAGGSAHADRPETCHFQRKFTLTQEQAGQPAELRICCDNRYVVRINQRLIGIGQEWKSRDRYDVTSVLLPGENSISVVARNDDGPAGLLVDLRVGAEIAPAWQLVSDGNGKEPSRRWDLGSECGVGSRLAAGGRRRSISYHGTLGD